MCSYYRLLRVRDIYLTPTPNAANVHTWHTMLYAHLVYNMLYVGVCSERDSLEAPGAGDPRVYN